ncbi:outer surface protein ErpG (plasmid) [Borreliella bissettiae]|uniref:Outer surface protein ErpG n=1 Tax=Borrelia bissettiae TaxID=64897 RepID=A0A1L8Z954_BORBI|nr:outer surface protein ErpG [Borreliella bissettiae]OJH14291.1 outer surface protein ErpG [Borreliella bissettiae]
MNKKMFTICVVFALIVSCKNYASGEDVKKSLEQSEQELKKQVKGFLDTKKEELVGGLKKLGSEAYSKVEEELMQADGPQVQAEEQVTQVVFEDLGLKEKGLERIGQKLQAQAQELKGLENNFKDKEEDRKKVLEEAKKKFEEFKRQVESATGTNDTEKVKKQGNIGREALKYAKGLGVDGNYSANDGTNTDDFSNKVIDDALKNINEELKKLNNKEE